MLAKSSCLLSCTEAYSELFSFCIRAKILTVLYMCGIQSLKQADWYSKSEAPLSRSLPCMAFSSAFVASFLVPSFNSPKTFFSRVLYSCPPSFKAPFHHLNGSPVILPLIQVLRCLLLAYSVGFFLL